MSDSASATVAPETEDRPPPAAPTTARPRPDRTPKRQPRYHVVLWNDDDHTYDYVVAMLRRLFGHPPEKGFQIAQEVDRTGRAIVLTTTQEHAELKRDQIHAFGADRLLARSKGSMSASIEPDIP
jgi:ATP-dependent Clp protease adaptor protein ClpS